MICLFKCLHIWDLMSNLWGSYLLLMPCLELQLNHSCLASTMRLELLPCLADIWWREKKVLFLFSKTHLARNLFLPYSRHCMRDQVPGIRNSEDKPGSLHCRLSSCIYICWKKNVIIKWGLSSCIYICWKKNVITKWGTAIEIIQLILKFIFCLFKGTNFLRHAETTRS